MGATLRADAVSRFHGHGASEVRALSDVALDIGDGEFVTVTGPSGSGKSTLLQLLGLLDTPTSGTIYLDGVDTATFSDDDRARARRSTFGFVFQSFYLLPGLRAWGNVAIPRMLDGTRLRSLRSEAEVLLDEVGLGDRVGHRPSDLSGGEQQRVAIARALIADPSIVLADEPTGALDHDNSVAVVDLLASLTVRRGRTLVVVTHDPDIANRPGARRDQLRDGRIVDVSRPQPAGGAPVESPGP